MVTTTYPTKKDLEIIRERDRLCVYCGKVMRGPCKDSPRSDWATIEHFNHRKDWDSVGSYMREGKPVGEIVGMCCGSCNASRRDLPLKEWFKRGYCLQRGINQETVAKPVKDYLSKFEED